MKKKPGIVAVSGGFDPLHAGHVRLLNEAKKLGDELVVLLNNDNWVKAKKGFVFMPERERKEVLEALRCVDRVVLTHHTPHDSDRSVSKALALLKPDVFANGGDRDEKNAADPTSSLYKDIETCKRLGIRMVFGVGKGGKVQSSSWLVQKIAGTVEVRPWGSMRTHVHEKQHWVKTITVHPGQRLSLQLHKYRSETWVCVAGTVVAEVGNTKRTLKPGQYVSFPPKTKHRLSSKTGGSIVEVGYGSDVREDDIVRFEDDFGRIPARV